MNFSNVIKQCQDLHKKGHKKISVPVVIATNQANEFLIIKPGSPPVDSMVVSYVTGHLFYVPQIDEGLILILEHLSTDNTQPLSAEFSNHANFSGAKESWSLNIRIMGLTITITIGGTSFSFNVSEQGGYLVGLGSRVEKSVLIHGQAIYTLAFGHPVAR